MKKNWQFKLDGEEQIVTLTKNRIKGKLILKVNDNILIDNKTTADQFVSICKKHPFKIGRRTGAIVTSLDKKRVHYDLTIDDVSVTTGQDKLKGRDKLEGARKFSLISAIISSILIGLFSVIISNNWIENILGSMVIGCFFGVSLFFMGYFMILLMASWFTTPIKEFTGGIDYQNLAKVGVTPTEQAPIPTFKDKMASVLSTATSTGMALMENAVPGSSNLINANSEQALQPVDETPAPAIHVAESRIDNAAAAVGGAALVVGAAAIGYKVVKGLGKGGSRTISSTTRSASRTINAAKSASNVVSSQKARQKQQAKQAAQRQHQASLQKQKELERQKNKRHQQQVERLERERLERERMQNRDYPSREEELDIAAELGQLHDEHPDQW